MDPQISAVISSSLSSGILRRVRLPAPPPFFFENRIRRTPFPYPKRDRSGRRDGMAQELHAARFAGAHASVVERKPGES